MNERVALSPDQAAAVVDDCIERFGLGAMPRVNVTATSDGRWLVHWEHRDMLTEPLGRSDWVEWVAENIGSLDAADLETTES